MKNNDNVRIHANKEKFDSFEVMIVYMKNNVHLKQFYIKTRNNAKTKSSFLNNNFYVIISRKQFENHHFKPTC